MKHIKYTEEFKTAAGYDFIILDPDPMVQQQAKDEAVARHEATFSPPVKTLTFAEAIIWFANGIPWAKDDKGDPARKLTPEEVGHAYGVIKAFRSIPDGVVSIEESDYTWLTNLVGSEGTAAFRVTQAVVVERLRELTTPAQ